MKYNFDEVVDRKNTNSMKVQGFRDYMFPNEKNLTFSVSDDELIKMWVADMEFATPQVIVDKMKERLDKRIFGYTKIFNDSYFEAFTNWTERRYGWSCKKEHWVTSPGIIPALYEIIGHVVAKDEKVITFTPAYGYFLYSANHNHRELVRCSLAKDGNKMVIDFDDFEKKLKDPKVKLLLLSHPHNPNGIIWSDEQLVKIAQLCEANDVWVISDEIHCDLLRSHCKHTPLAKLYPNYDKIITCMSPSKTFNLAGMMLSNIVIPNAELMEKWNTYHHAMENPLSVVAVEAAYADGEDWLNELLLYLDGNFAFLKEYLEENLPKAKFEIPDATYLAWIDFSEYISDESIDLALFFAKESNVLLEAANQFVQDGEGYVRLNLACPRAMLKEALDNIAKTLNNL